MTHSKSLTLLGLSCLCILPCGLMAHSLVRLAAPEHTQRFYVEAIAGHGKVEEKRSRLLDGQGTFYNASIGYWVQPSIAIDVSYAKFHDISFQHGSDFSTVHKDKENYFWGAGMRGRTSVSNNIDLFATIGLGYTHRKTPSVVTHPGDHEGLTAYYAAGTKMHLSPQADFLIKLTASTGAFTGNKHGVPPMYGLGGGLGLNM